MPNCPHCNHPLTDQELRSLWGAHCSAQRKADKGGAPRKLSPKQRADIRRLRAAGATHQALANRYGVSRATILRELAK